MKSLNLVTSTPIKGNINQSNNQKLYVISNEYTVIDKDNESDKIYSYKSIKRKMYERTLKNTREVGSTREQEMAVAHTQTAPGTTQQVEDYAAQFAPTGHTINKLLKQITSTLLTIAKSKKMSASGSEKTRKSLLIERQEEDELYLRATRSAGCEALRQLRDDRMRIWREFLPEDDEEEVPNEAEFHELWNEEIDRSRRMLEALYNNLQMTNGTRLYKKTTTIKNKLGQETTEITSVVMLRHRCKTKQKRTDRNYSQNNRQRNDDKI